MSIQPPDHLSTPEQAEPPGSPDRPGSPGSPNSRYLFTLPMKVRDYEVDSQGIVNNAVYLHYLEHTRHEFCEHFGISFRQMQAEGCDPVVSRVAIDYRRPLRLAERFDSCLWLERRGVRFVFHQDLYDASGLLVAGAEVSIVALEHGRLTRGERLAEVFAQCLR